MLFGIFVFLLLQITSASFVMRCSNGTDLKGTVQFRRVESPFKWRYVAEVCTDVDPEVAEWKVTVSFYNLAECAPLNSMHRHRRWRHSNNEEWTNFTNTCTNVCLSTDFDLIFQSCYYIESYLYKNATLKKGKELWRRHSGYFNITNSFTKDKFIKNKAHVEVISHDQEEDDTIIWHTGIPVSNYEVKIFRDSLKGAGAAGVVLPCAARDEVTLWCRARRPPAGHCNTVRLYHAAPWVSGVFSEQAEVPLTYCNNDTGAGNGTTAGVAAGGGQWALWAAAGGAGALALGAAALAACGASTRARAFRRDVHRMWRKLTDRLSRTDQSDVHPRATVHRWMFALYVVVFALSQAEPSEGALPAPNKEDILLLYARENAAGQRFIDIFKEMLQHTTEGQVLDVQCARTLSRLAAAPLAGVAAAVRGAKVVVLQTPAMRCLYAAPPDHKELLPSAPLMLGSVVRRCPSFGDQLLLYALRLLADTPHAHTYKQVFIAELSALPAEVLPRVVSYARYGLPGAAPLLLRAAGGAPGAGEALLPEFSQALHEFVELVRSNPDYLMDELLVM